MLASVIKIKKKNVASVQAIRFPWYNGVYFFFSFYGRKERKLEDNVAHKQDIWHTKYVH